MAYRALSAAGAILTVILLVVVACVMATPFPFEALGVPLLTAKPPVDPEVFSRALWGARSWDGVILSFILLFSAIGAIALFRVEEQGG